MFFFLVLLDQDSFLGPLIAFLFILSMTLPMTFKAIFLQEQEKSTVNDASTLVLKPVGKSAEAETEGTSGRTKFLKSY